MKRLLTVAVFALMLLGSVSAQESPKREFRGAWLHIVGNSHIKDMSMEEIQTWFTTTLDTLKMCGCNAIIFQVRPQADAFYQSDLEPWTRFLTGEQGVAPDPWWDPLQFMIDEAHSRGMELHAWLNPYRVTSNDKEQLSPDHLYFRKPEIFRRYGKQLFFDPGEPESIEHTVNVIADIVNRYDVDAIHFDDYFYPYAVRFEEFHDDASFVKYAASQGFEYWQKGDWRRNNVETLIKAVNDTIKSIKPWIRFGISPFGIHRNLKDTPDGSGSRTNGLANYDELFADVPGWADKGYIDYIVPQLYWTIGTAAADFEILINWWNDSNFKGHLYIGESLASLSAKDLQDSSKTQMPRKMQLVRELPNVDGNVWWPGWSITKKNASVPPRNGRLPIDLVDEITNYQKYPALIPAYSDIDSIAPAPVKRLKRYGALLTWSVEPVSDVMQQPHFFVVYKFAAGSKIDLTSSKNIVKITRGTSYVPEGKRDGKYQYVVTVVDKCWNESPASNPVKW